MKNELLARIDASHDVFLTACRQAAQHRAGQPYTDIGSQRPAIARMIDNPLAQAELRGMQQWSDESAQLALENA